MSIDDVCTMQRKIIGRKYSIDKFKKYFSAGFRGEKIDYLFEINKYLPSKAHSIAGAQILCLSMNYKKLV
jgi:hypothetical protein